MPDLLAIVAELPVTVSWAARGQLRELAAIPDDFALRERVARRLDAEGAHAAASSVLAAFKHLNRHEEDGGLPCLCKKDLASAPAEASVGGVTFGRTFVCHGDRVLHFWAPRDLLSEADTLSSMRMSLGRRVKQLARERKQRARTRAR